MALVSLPNIADNKALYKSETGPAKEPKKALAVLIMLHWMPLQITDCQSFTKPPLANCVRISPPAPPIATVPKAIPLPIANAAPEPNTVEPTTTACPTIIGAKNNEAAAVPTPIIPPDNIPMPIPAQTFWPLATAVNPPYSPPKIAPTPAPIANVINSAVAKCPLGSA